MIPVPGERKPPRRKQNLLRKERVVTVDWKDTALLRLSLIHI